VLLSGRRTRDLVKTGSPVGTSEMGRLVAEGVQKRDRRPGAS